MPVEMSVPTLRCPFCLLHFSVDALTVSSSIHKNLHVSRSTTLQLSCRCYKLMVALMQSRFQQCELLVPMSVYCPSMSEMTRAFFLWSPILYGTCALKPRITRCKLTSVLPWHLTHDSTPHVPHHSFYKDKNVPQHSFSKTYAKHAPRTRHTKGHYTLSQTTMPVNFHYFALNGKWYAAVISEILIIESHVLFMYVSFYCAHAHACSIV